mmetsp:Transcript_28151/g.31280  ORF Transcript_28151/g.31280 Transcript_28151/m.31280 type:complete len:80 (-) Transcript_28151:773-1012(-)
MVPFSVPKAIWRMQKLVCLRVLPKVHAKIQNQGAPQVPSTASRSGNLSGRWIVRFRGRWREEQAVLPKLVPPLKAFLGW